MFRPASISVYLAACFIVGHVSHVCAESYVDKGKKFFAAKDYKNAMICFQARLKKNPKDPFANYYAALSYQATGDIKMAYDHYKTAARYAGKNNIRNYSLEAMKSLRPRLSQSATSSKRTKPLTAKQLKQKFLSNLEEHKKQMELVNQKIQKEKE